MKKGIKGLIVGAAVMVLGSIAAFAAPSITKNGAVSQDFTINGEVGDTTKYRATFELPLEKTVESQDVLDVINAVNAEPAKVSELLKGAEVSEADQALVSDFLLLTEIQDLSIVEVASGEPVKGLTNVTLTWEVPNLTREMKNIRVLHYSTVRNVWEILVPDQVDFENKAITQTFPDLSPVAVLYTLDDGSSTAPGTGDSSPIVLYVTLAAAALIIAAVVAFFRRKAKN